MSVIKVNNITNKTGIAGPAIAGIVTVSSSSHFVVPTGHTGQRYADGGENIVRDGLVLYLDAKYSYPGATGTNPDVYTWYDMSGNENHGELKNGVGYNSANGGSLSFDGTNDLVTLTGTESFNFGTGDFTIECWVYFNNINTQQIFISKYSAWGNNADFLFRLTLGGINKIRVYYSPFTFIAESSVIAPSTWYHICVSRISNATTFYTNGSSTGTHTGAISITNNRNTLRLGLSHDDDEPLNGRISNFRVYKGKGLSAAEVSQNFNAARSRYGI